MEFNPGRAMQRALLASFFLVSSLFGAIDSKVDIKRVHEAFISKTHSLIPIEVIGKKPPGPKEERPPAKTGPEHIWIHGYWAWEREKGEFQWVCGVWRVPPPGQTWVPGFWKNDGGWYWVSGMWLESPSNVSYAKELPPQNPEEEMGDPPGEEYFWASGFWEYNPYEKNFRWLSGSWQPFDENWVLIPATWQWRPEGYHFRPSYWDYPLDKRGIAYDCSKDGGYQPIPEKVLISRIYYTYPDYSCFFWHHYHFHPEFWEGCWCTPPWWGWQGWWTFNYSNSWGLWWWWSHPGFSAPFWMDPFLASQILPPDQQLIMLLKGGKFPFFFTKGGVPLQNAWIQALMDTTGKASPLLPENLWNKAQEIAGKDIKNNDLSPSGSHSSKKVPKPEIGPKVTPYGPAIVPQVPGQKTAPLPPKPSIKLPESSQPAPEIEGGSDIWGEPNVRWPNYERPRPRPRPQVIPQPRPRPPQNFNPQPKPESRPRPTPPSGKPDYDKPQTFKPEIYRPQLSRPQPPKYPQRTWIEKEPEPRQTDVPY